MKKILKYSFLALMLLMPICAKGQTTIQMEKESGVYKIPCLINGLRLKLIFDTGASKVCISGGIADMMLENGYLSREDIKGSGQSQVADGRIVDNTIINIKELKIEELMLRNVEAVVIHQQSAPLLLGQSAIQKLGNVTIQGNNLIINKLSGSPVESKKRFYSQKEIDEMFDNAFDAMENNSYELATEYWEILYEIGQLSAYGKFKYAGCLRSTNKTTEAISIYNEVLEDIEHLDIELHPWVYFGMQACYKSIKDYDSSIKYGQMALLNTTFAFNLRINMIYLLASAYKEKGDIYTSKRVIKNEISKYLSYMELKATDCWHKGYKDPYLAELYYYLYLIDDINNYEKWTIVSAAWGYKNAIENCKKFEYEYTSKPNKYEY